MTTLQHNLQLRTGSTIGTERAPTELQRPTLAGPAVDRGDLLDEMHAAATVATRVAPATTPAQRDPLPESAAAAEAAPTEESRGWFSRVWRGATGVVRGAARLAQDAGKFVYDMATDPDKRAAVAAAIGDGVASAGKAVWGVVQSAASYVHGIATDPEKRAALMESIRGVASAAWEIATDPQTYVNAARAVGSAIYTLATDPKAALNAVLSGVKLASDIIGFTDLVLTFKHAGLGLIEYGNGNDKAALGHFAQAAMHGTFAALSVGSIAATVATAGAAGGTIVAVAAGRMALREGTEYVLKVAARELLESGAQQIGKEVVGTITERVGAQALQHTLSTGAREAVDQGVKELAERITQQGAGALTHEAMQETMRNSAAQVTERILRDLKVPEIVSDQTLTLLREMQGKSVSELTEILSQRGVADPRGAAREFHRALQTGTADELLKKTLEDGISREIAQMVEQGMERDFKAQLRRALSGEAADASSQTLARAVREQAEEMAQRTGRSVVECQRKLVDDYVESGWRGAREGIEQATRKVVREGIDDAFNRLRKRDRGRVNADGGAAAAVLSRRNAASEERAELPVEAEQEEGAARGRADSRVVRHGPTITYETQREVEADGAETETLLRINHVTGKHEIVAKRSTGVDDRRDSERHRRRTHGRERVENS